MWLNVVSSLQELTALRDGVDTVSSEYADTPSDSATTVACPHPFVGLPVTDGNPDHYVGLFWSDDLGTEWRVEADTGNAGGIALLHRTQDTDRFLPAFRDGFWSGGDWLTFVRDRRGRVTGFTWSNGRVRKVAFTRR